ncbi:hypothetical protein RFI_27891 [Reticulomyxa filosa]|uniref:CSD domain-containing protein n=1 Tax=Reticulomyxa filosa TaxID=46433 RepID=X6M780_RETFI|nr:hypothetical protein RFI_27891 [Reticulomyxa filosa]|eukprot:ETO09486.1 hypothetical protein RFI_27891 [Reticulomyxa filosa]
MSIIFHFKQQKKRLSWFVLCARHFCFDQVNTCNSAGSNFYDEKMLINTNNKKQIIEKKVIEHQKKKKKKKNNWQRHQGYVSFVESGKKFGFVIPDAFPEKECHFHYESIVSSGPPFKFLTPQKKKTKTKTNLTNFFLNNNMPHKRPLQRVEFNIKRTSEKFGVATNVTLPGAKPVEYKHENLSLKREARTQRLSKWNVTGMERHKGVYIGKEEEEEVVEQEKGTGKEIVVTYGIIVPDKVGYQTVKFDMQELQATGVLKLNEFSEVEFYVRSQPSKQINEKKRRRSLGPKSIATKKQKTGHIASLVQEGD